MNDIRNTMTFAWLVVGLLVSKTIHLGQWGLLRDSRALAAGRERQIARWLHNPKIKADAVYRDLVTAALLPWAKQTAVLALDSSVLWESYVIVRIALIYRGRGLPLAWKLLAQGSASVSFVNYAPLLTEVSRLLPPFCCVVLLADRGFVDVNLLQRVVRLVDAHWQRGLSYFQIGWRYLARTLAGGGPLLTALWLDPAPDTEPVYASIKSGKHTNCRLFLHLFRRLTDPPPHEPFTLMSNKICQSIRLRP